MSCSVYVVVQLHHEYLRPFQILKQRRKPSAFSNSISHRRQRDVSESVEDNDNGEPDFPAVNVVLVQVSIKPANGEIIGNGQNPCGANGVVGPNVADNGDFGGEADVGEEEFTEEGCEGSGCFDTVVVSKNSLKKKKKKIVAACGCEVLIHTLSITMSGWGGREARCNHMRTSPIGPVRRRRSVKHLL